MYHAVDEGLSAFYMAGNKEIRRTVVMLHGMRQGFTDTVYCQQESDELVDEHTGEVAADTEGGNRKDDEGNADSDAGKVMYENLRGFSKPVQNCKESGIQVHQRTDPGECADEGTGEFIVEKQVSGKIAQKEKTEKTADT